MIKIAIVIFSAIETQEGLGRVVNALQTAREFKEAGDEVQIIFDGGGTTAAVALADPADERHQVYAQVADKVAGLCRYCAKAFGAYDKAEELVCPSSPSIISIPACARGWLTATRLLPFSGFGCNCTGRCLRQDQATTCTVIFG